MGAVEVPDTSLGEPLRRLGHLGRRPRSELDHGLAVEQLGDLGGPEDLVGGRVATDTHDDDTVGIDRIGRRWGGVSSERDHPVRLG